MRLLDDLRAEHGFSGDWLCTLRELIENREPAIEAALQQFGDDSDWAELVDTLDLVVVQSQMNAARAQAKREHVASLLKKPPPLPDAAKDRRQLMALIEKIRTETKLEKPLWDNLKDMANTKNPVLDAAFSLYNEDPLRQWREFVDTVTRLSKCSNHNATTLNFDECLDQLVESKRIDASSAKEIRLRLASNDPFVTALFQVFANDKDREELKDTIGILSEQLQR